MRVAVRRAGTTRRPQFGYGTALVTGVTVFLAVALIAALAFIVSPAGSSASASYLHAQPGSLHWNQRDRLNVLLIGTASGTRQPAAVDSLTVASFDPTTHSLSLLSVPTKLWLTIPGYGEGRIGDAYRDGGSRTALLAIETALHVPIPYYVALPDRELGQLVDAVGGVAMNIPASVTTVAASGGSRVFRAGKRVFSGTEAVQFGAPGSAAADAGPQMWRQQTVFVALGRQLLQPENFPKVPVLVNSLGASMHTNFPFDEIQALAYDFLAVRKDRVLRAVLDRSSAATSSYGTGPSAVLLPQWGTIRSLAERLFSYKGIRSTSGLEVWNGGGQQGEATVLAAWLQLAKISVTRYGTAPSLAHPGSRVILTRPKESGARRLARAVSALLQIPLSSGKYPAARSGVVVIIGRDFIDPSQR